MMKFIKNTATQLIPIGAAGIIALAAISGLITVNINHNLNAPKELFTESTIETSGNFLTGYKYDVYLEEEIRDNSYSVQKIVEMLNNASSRDTIVFHLGGFGGSVNTGVQLVNTIKASKAKEVIMIVEAPVYSMHAFLAVSGTKMIMEPDTYLYFHTSTAFDETCDEVSGIDRAEDAKSVCQDMKAKDLDLANKLINDAYVLSSQEKQLVKDGYTVIISPKDVYNNIHKNSTPYVIPVNVPNVITPFTKPQKQGPTTTPLTIPGLPITLPSK